MSAETNQQLETRGSRRAARTGHRILEIDGLRGIALTLVVIFHLFGQGRVSGGVDVFLTVSGFLLIMSLGRSLANMKPLGIVARWGRTFSRLAPPATLVLVAVTIASLVVLSPLNREQNLLEVISTAFYFENWQLVATQLAYGAAGPETSPLQHFWSLSVQAQFFIGFPLLVGLLTLVTKSRRARVTLFWSLLGAATLASFIYAWNANAVNPQEAYFDTFARFWELGAGGLIAGLLMNNRALPAVLRPITGWLGLSMIISSGFIFSGGTAYPGPAALLPVGGAVLVLLSANGGWLSPTPLLRSRPLVFLDSISYGLYLWHWPILIVFFTVKERDVLGWRGACFVMGLAFVIALVTRWILTPAIVWATSKKPRHALIFALIAIIVAGAPAGAALGIQATKSANVVVDPCAGAASLDPERPECAGFGKGAELRPSLDKLRQDMPRIDECWNAEASTEVNVCTVGDVGTASKYLLVVGDSHNDAWIESYKKTAEDLGWAMDISSRAGCQWISPDAPRRGTKVEAQNACIEWRNAMNELAHSSKYDAILTTASTKTTFEPVPDGMTYENFHAGLIEEAWSHRSSEDVPIIALRDTPFFPESAIECLQNASMLVGGVCSEDRTKATQRPTGVYQAIEATPNAHLIDLNDYICEEYRCNLVVGGVVTTWDGNHQTSTFNLTLTPYLERELVTLLE